MSRTPKTPVEEFIRIWQSAKSGKEAAERSGMTVGGASCRANYLRGRGVPLKKFLSHGGYFDVAALSKVAREAREQK